VKASARQPFVSVQVEPAKTKATTSGKQFEVRVTVAANAPAGAFADQISIQLRGGDVRQVLIPVTGYVSDDVTVEPRLVVLPRLVSNSVWHKTVMVQAPGSRTFSIKNISSRNPNITAKANSHVVASAHAVEISGTVQGEAGTSIQDRVTLTLSDDRTLDIDILGTVAQSGENNPLVGKAVPEQGKMAPEFTSVDSNGKQWQLSALRGQKNLLLTFFPKCFTGGCANHLSSLRDHQAEFDAADTQILAVSVDPAEGEKGQIAFAKQWNLSFPLIPDTERKLSLLYGAVQMPADLTSRMTVFIDKQGIVRFIDRDVNVMTHGSDVLNKMKELGLGK
jgi:peroxiredoxin Q/BCP